MSLNNERENQKLYEVTEAINEGSNTSGGRSATENQENTKISLLNFDPYCKFATFLNSPLSIEACKIEGVEEWELLAKTKEDFKQEYIPTKFQEYQEEFLELKANYHEKCRLKRLEACLKTRNTLNESRSSAYNQNEITYTGQYQQEKSYNGEGTHSFVMSPKKILETGRKQISVIKRKQNQEIELIMETEKMKEQLDLRMEEKMQKVQEIRDLKKAEFERREKEAQEAKIKRDLRKKQFEEEREQRRRRKNYSFAENYENGNTMRTEPDMTMNTSGSVSFRKKREVSKSPLINTLQQRLLNLQEAEEKKKEALQQQYMEKMKKNEELKTKLESERKLSIENRRSSMETKKEEILKDKEIKEKIAIQKEKQFMNKLEDIQRQREKVAKEKELEMREKSIREIEHAEQVRQKAKMGEKERELRVQTLSEEIEVDLSRAEKQRKELLSERRQIYMVNYLKEEEAQRKLDRKERMLKYQAEKLEDRIEVYSQRMRSRSKEKEAVTKESAAIIRDLSKEREKAKEEFEKVQRKLKKEHHARFYQSPVNRSMVSGGYTSRLDSTKSQQRSLDNKEEIFVSLKRRSSNGLSDSVVFSTPTERNKTSTNTNFGTRSDSRSTTNTIKNVSGFNSSIIEMVNTSYDAKEKSLTAIDQKDDQQLENRIGDEEYALFARRPFSIRCAKITGLQELARIIDKDMTHVQTTDDFKKSADTILNNVKLQNDCFEALMQETNYLDLPWADFRLKKC